MIGDDVMDGGRYVRLSRKIMAADFVQRLQQTFRLLNQQILVASVISVINFVVLDCHGFLKEIFGINKWLPFYSAIHAATNSLAMIICTILVISVAYSMGSKENVENSLAGYISGIMTIIFLFPGDVMTGKINQNILLNGYNAINLRNLLIAAIVGYLVGRMYEQFSQSLTWQLAWRVGVTLLILLVLFIMTRNDWTELLIGELYGLIDGMQNWSIIAIPILAMLNCVMLIFGVDSLLPMSGAEFSHAATKNLNYVLEGHSVYSVPAPINIHALFDTYATQGGIGMLLPLVIAVWIINRHRHDIRNLKWTTIPTLFNLNAPLLTNYPILFNLILLVPMMISSAVTSLIPGILILLGWLPSSVYPVSLSAPGLLQGYFSTNGNWLALCVGLFNLVISVLIYMPFIKISDQELQVSRHEI